jgi:hypothetical protein
LGSGEVLKEQAMSSHVVPLVEEQPPSSKAQRVVARASQYLLYFICLAPIALFPIGLAHRILTYFFP